VLIKFGEPSQLSSGSANPRMTATKELGSRTASSVRADLEKGRDTSGGRTWCAHFPSTGRPPIRPGPIVGRVSSTWLAASSQDSREWR